MSRLNVKTYCLGMWQTNSYLLTAEETEKCWIIDAGFDPERLVADIKSAGLVPEYLVYTHAHLDHIAGTAVIREAFPGIKTVISTEEASFLGDPAKNLSSGAGMTVTADDADMVVEDGDSLEFEGLSFRIIATPGHSPGGICVYQEEGGLLFSGDTLFQGSVGRYDFPTSDGEALFDSIRRKLLPLPDGVKVFPGHGGATTIGDEKANNPFLK